MVVQLWEVCMVLCEYVSVCVRYKTRAHKAEARLQEEASKQKIVLDAGDTSTPAGHVTEEQQQIKVIHYEVRYIHAVRCGVWCAG